MNGARATNVQIVDVTGWVARPPNGVYVLLMRLC